MYTNKYFLSITDTIPNRKILKLVQGKDPHQIEFYRVTWFETEEVTEKSLVIIYI